MKAVQVAQPKSAFEMVERPVPEPGRGEVRVRIEACGVCHSDAMAKEGYWPGVAYPCVPGHEVAGRIDKLGPEVPVWQAGDRVGVGWHGGHCFYCESCRRGDFINCERGMITGLTRDGGYQQYTIARAEALARIPDELTAVEAAPLLCAGVTTFNSLRHSGARPGDLVAVQGIGGLGHLAVQYASRMGFRTVAISGGASKEEQARRLGAHHYIDSSATDPAAELQRLGGAQVILATAPNGQIIAPMVGGLSQRGKLLIVAAAADPLPVSALALIPGRSVAGWPSGSAVDSEDAMRFSALTGVRAQIETFPLADAGRAYEHMLANRVRFRAVLQIPA